MNYLLRSERAALISSEKSTATIGYRLQRDKPASAQLLVFYFNSITTRLTLDPATMPKPFSTLLYTCTGSAKGLS